ncbi:MAG: hypothetical protein ACK4I8_01235 [Armatimonadota bacterium]
MNRASIVSELAKVLQVNEAEAERILKAFAQVLGPIAAEVPPYFERYFETQIQLVLQRIEDLERSTQQQFADLRHRIDLIEKRIDRLEKWLLSVLVMILSGVLAIIFRIYFGG